MSTALTTDATAHKPSTELTSNRSTTRIHWIDIAKGIGIILVSFGHIRNGDGQSVWLPALDTPINFIYLFHMPLFFFLGGLTFSSRRSFPDFLKRKAQTLLIPYYVFFAVFSCKTTGDIDRARHSIGPSGQSRLHVEHMDAIL